MSLTMTKSWFLFWLRRRWCRLTGGHGLDTVRLGDLRSAYEIHRWCPRCGLHGVIKAGRSS
jgi:hypothetical protein